MNRTVRIGRRRSRRPSSWACVAESTPPAPIWLGSLAELKGSRFGLAQWRTRGVIGCHGDGWCVHCGRQLPRLTVTPPNDAAEELRALLARVATLEVVGG